MLPPKVMLNRSCSTDPADRGRECTQALATLSAKRDEGHETGLRQRVAPAMSGSVLHDAIALAQMDLLSVVQFQRHLATNHDPIIDGIGCVHTWRVAFEMVTHARDLLRHFPQPTLESDAGWRLPAFRSLGRIRDKSKHRAPRAGKGFRSLNHRHRFLAGEPLHTLSHVEFIECQSRIGVDRHHLRSYVKGLEHRFAGFIAAGQYPFGGWQVARVSRFSRL